MKYITETLGMAVKYDLWNDFTGLPMFIPDNYEIKKASIGNISCLFIKPKGEFPTVPALKKHFEIIGKKIALPRVAILDKIAARQRKALINAQIPFVIDNTQLYLPFMGIALNERFSQPKAIPETLMPSTQLLLFYYLYQNKGRLYMNHMAKKLNVSKMQITRAVEQLSALEIITADKDGVRVFIESKENKTALFEKSRPFLLNPVRKRIYVEADTLPKGLPYAGITALSEYSMLAPPRVSVYAYFGKVTDLQGTDSLIDNGQVEVENWRYNPALLPVSPDVVDPLSVAISLQRVDDPRVEQAIEEIIKGIGNQKWLED